MSLGKIVGTCGIVLMSKFGETVPPGLDSETDVVSKDTTIIPETGVKARLYHPNSTPETTKLPSVIYLHGRGFMVSAPADPLYHNNTLNKLVAEANVVAVSVDYRLVPEHLLPAAYEDSWTALQWVASHASEDGKGSEKHVSLLTVKHIQNTCVMVMDNNIKRCLDTLLSKEPITIGPSYYAFGSVHPYLIDPKRKKDGPTRIVATKDDIFLAGEVNSLNVFYDDYSWIDDSDSSFHVNLQYMMGSSPITRK
ncbi:probable carboxylesterase 2 [Lotus japonicus]|uniref:probable carboxylesterase 2 n=1 Tax=Lotus japonicus TaxID=34305 RepID=UPI0025882BC8|nr:probable carboxylesterase 2 [Lotus japonicus]